MIEQFFPASKHLAIKFLGKKDWLDLTVDPEQGTVGTIKDRIPFEPEDRRQFKDEDMKEAARLLEIYASRNSSSAFFLLQVSRAMADGPKLFRPTHDQCIGLENVEVTVPFDKYKQPYPVVVLEIPKTYREYIKTKYNVKHAPVYVLAHKQEPQNIISVTAWFHPDEMIVNIMGPRTKFATIEDALIHNRTQTRTTVPDFDLLKKALPGLGQDALQYADKIFRDLQKDADEYNFGVAELVQRLGINFSMMMTTLGTSVMGPTNTTPEREAKQRKMLNRGNDDEKYRARRLLASITHEIKLNQEIRFFDQQTEKVQAKPGQHTGKILEPHWRRGHWRFQWHGPGLTLYKYVFIEAQRINKELDSVDLSETSVTYTGASSGT
jgi:hypothetical protein